MQVPTHFFSLSWPTDTLVIIFDHFNKHIEILLIIVALGLWTLLQFDLYLISGTLSAASTPGIPSLSSSHANGFSIPLGL